MGGFQFFGLTADGATLCAFFRRGFTPVVFGWKGTTAAAVGAHAGDGLSLRAFESPSVDASRLRCGVGLPSTEVRFPGDR